MDSTTIIRHNPKSTMYIHLDDLLSNEDENENIKYVCISIFHKASMIVIRCHKKSLQCKFILMICCIMKMKITKNVMLASTFITRLPLLWLYYSACIAEVLAVERLALTKCYDQVLKWRDYQLCLVAWDESQLPWVHLSQKPSVQSISFSREIRQLLLQCCVSYTVVMNSGR